MIGELTQSFAAMLSPIPFLLVFLGTTLGIIVGAIPGLNGAMLVALSLPLTFGWHPLNAIALLVGQYVGSISGGLISATLLNIPGTPSNMMTTLDAMPMARAGKPERALQIGILASFVGGLVSWFALVLLSPPLARVALLVGPHEFFSLVFVALVLIASMSDGSMVRALIGAVLGMLVALPGLDPVTGQLRLDFGFPAMVGGFDLLAVLVGIFAVTQLLIDTGPAQHAESIRLKAKSALIPMRDFFAHWRNLLRSSLIGTWIGLLPGVGGSVGSIVSYSMARNLSRTPERFGTGIDDGIVASEAANNATIGGALIPMITMGIPGSIIDVILIAALTLHDLRPGPLLFQSNPEIVYGFMSTMFISNVLMLVIMLFSLRWLARLIEVPKNYLIPILLLFCVVGTYAVNNRMFDVVVMFAFGLVGILLRAVRIPTAPFVIGFILTPIAERSLRSALIADQGDWTGFLTRPISATFLIIAVAMLLLPVWQRLRHEEAF